MVDRVYPNPKTWRVLQFREPETTRTQSFQDFSNPKLPEPEIQTRGYPTGLETLKIIPKVLKFIPKTIKTFKSIRKWLYLIAKNTILASF